MFEALLGKIAGSTPMSERAEGAAFLKVARDLYQLKSLAYLGVNIPVASGQPRQRLSAQSRAAHQWPKLDCLKWTAAGKTAWEASVILGISQRTSGSIPMRPAKSSTVQRPRRP
jgi:hypothetical protein